MPKRKKTRMLILLQLAMLASFSLAARPLLAQPKFTSAFTHLSKDCQDAFKTVGEGQDMPLKCKGYGQYYVYIYYSALASHISIKIKGREDFIYLTKEKIDYSEKKDSQIEWRLADGKPFAVILKVGRYNKEVQDTGENPFQDKYRIGEVVLVQGLKGHEYMNFQVDARKTPNALVKARELADKGYLFRTSGMRVRDLPYAP